MTTVNDVIQQLENFAPKSLAEDWDPIGLIFGSKDQIVHKIMVALDLDRDTLNEAKNKNVDFIITHHPPIFSSIQTLNQEDPRRAEYVEMIRNNIALYSLHTNLDAAEGGMNDWLADALGISQDREIIKVTTVKDYYKLIVFTPKYATSQITEALFESGAGQVGDYTNVHYRTNGYGHFTPGPNSDPAEGNIGEETKVEEERIEVLVSEDDIEKVIPVLLTAHPYEEPVYDVFQLENKKKEYGLGRIGDYQTTTEDLAEQLKETFNLEGLRYGSLNPTEEKNKVAVLGGSGAEYYKEALEKGAQIFITGDISYHEAQDMIRDGIDFIDPGHYIEQIMVPKLTEKIKKFKKDEQWDLEIIEAETQTDMFTFK